MVSIHKIVSTSISEFPLINQTPVNSDSFIQLCVVNLWRINEWAQLEVWYACHSARAGVHADRVAAPKDAVFRNSQAARK